MTAAARATPLQLHTPHAAHDRLSRLCRNHGDLSREFVQSGTTTWQCLGLADADGAQQVHQDNAADVPSQNELKTALEKGSDEHKIETMVRLRNCNCPAGLQLAV